MEVDTSNCQIAIELFQYYNDRHIVNKPSHVAVGIEAAAKVGGGAFIFLVIVKNYL